MFYQKHCWKHVALQCCEFKVGKRSLFRLNKAWWSDAINQYERFHTSTARPLPDPLAETATNSSESPARSASDEKMSDEKQSAEPVEPSKDDSSLIE